MDHLNKKKIFIKNYKKIYKKYIKKIKLNEKIQKIDNL